VTVAMGLDDKTVNDDEDAVMEVRMMHKIHRLSTFDLTEPPMDPYTALEIATVNGAKVCGFEDRVGTLGPGMRADAVLVDLDRVANDPWLHPDADVVEAFVQRALGSDVRTVLVGGRVVLEDRVPTAIDVDALYAEIRAFCAKGISPEQRAFAEGFARVKPHIQRWYRGWDGPVMGRPHYPVNSRA